MSKLLREVKQFIKPYNTTKGIRYSVSIPDGFGFRIRQQAFVDEASAIKFAAEKYNLVLSGKGKSFHGSSMTFQDYSKEFIETKKREQVEEVTIIRYSDQIKNFLNPFFGSLKLAKIEKHHLRNYIEDCYRDGISTYNAWSTVTLFKMMIRKALEHDYPVDERVLLVKTPQHKAKKPVFWGVEQVNYFLNAAKKNKKFLMWKFTLFSGLRAGEVAALTWDSVQSNLHLGGHTGYISVTHSRSQKTKKIKGTKTNEHRMIPMAPQLKEVIEILSENKKGNYVFGGDKPLDTSHWARSLQSEIEKHPVLPRLTFHQLRHSFCSYLEATGMPRRIVAAIMGHKDLSTTDKYSHVGEQMLGSVFGKWSENQNIQNSDKVGLHVV